ncbi:MAG: hypothetical protein O7G85_01510 [Planctomycetota bacterium]|nr:hypothetical protein [Planctomycetota bacterium]
MRIPLPFVCREPNDKTHPFPVQIALQTQEFMQASIYHIAFMDIATGQRIRLPNGLAEVEQELFDGGLEKIHNDEAWALLQKYQSIFSRFVYQNVLILLRSHWDWYIDKLAAFTQHGNTEIGGPTLSNNAQKNLERLGFAAIRRQIEILEQCTGLTFQFDASTIDHAEEMALVRNLGIHNRWEVNYHYRSKSIFATRWSEGELRVFDATELEQWHISLINMIHNTSFPIAKLYCSASDYPA